MSKLRGGQDGRSLQAQVLTVRHGKQVRMQAYASPEEALEAAGLRE